MKRRIFSILAVLALVLSFSLVTAVPAAAADTYNMAQFTLGAAGTGTSVWSTDQAKTGTHSVLLTHAADGAGSVYVDFVPLATETLASFQADITNTTNDWTFEWSMASTGSVNGPQFELRFEDPTDDGWLEVTAVGLQGTTGSGVANFNKETLAGATLAGYGGWGEAGVSGSFYSWSTLTLLSGIEAAVNGESNVTSASDWVLTRVRVELWESTTLAAHIDDITIKGTTYYGLFEDVIDVAAATGDTISVAAGTYNAETTWPIDVDKALTIQGAGVTSIIDPGSAGRGVIAISDVNVTIDGFTIIHGTQAVDATDRTENTIWVAAEYSTISNNTILTRGGNKAGIYIGGRDGGDATSIFHYDITYPVGHTIEDNIFRNANAGEGWGIFAYELKDSLIHGNTFSGDAAWTTNAVEGAPGTGIIIRAASAVTGDPSPGGGYVIIEDNTAQYIKYTWLTFSPHFMFVDLAGGGTEKVDASTVQKVIVRNNTVSDSDVGVTLKPSFINYTAYDDDAASLTIGSDLVTIGPGNNFHDVYKGVDIDDPEELAGDGGFGGSPYYLVVDADNIIINYNDIYDASEAGVYNGMYHPTLSGISAGPLTIDARYNYWGGPSGPTITATNPRGTGAALNTYITYEPWLHTTQATVVADNTRYYAYNLVSLQQGWNIFSTPIALDEQVATWSNYKTFGVPLALDSGSAAYYFDASLSTPAWDIVTANYVLRPSDAIYIKMASAQVTPILFSAAVSAPSKMLYPGWNLVSASFFNSLDAPDLTVVSVEIALASVYYATGASNIGYSVVTSPAVNQTAWSGVRKADIATAFTRDMIPTEGYWVHMVNGGTLVGEVFTPVLPLLDWP